MLTFLQLYGAITGLEYQKMNEYTKEQSERIRKELINSENRTRRKRKMTVITISVLIPTVIVLFVLSQQIFIPAFLRAKSYRDLINHSVKTGDTIVFGDKFLNNKWRVLTVQGSKVFIVNQRCIIGSPGMYQSQYIYDIPDYLNNEYYDCLFSDNERAMICETDHGKIFLLSAEEARTYFADDTDRIAGSNRYNRDYYLLRDLSNNWNGGYRCRMYVNNVGAIIDDNVDGRFGIRPAMWLDMDKAVS